MRIARCGNGVLHQHRQGILECCTESGTEPGALGGVPCGGFFGFSRRGGVESYWPHLLPRTRAAIRSITSAASTVCTVPDLISCIRRVISSAHASSTRSSSGPSRLAITSCISSARSSAGSLRTCSFNCFIAALAIPAPISVSPRPSLLLGWYRWPPDNSCSGRDGSHGLVDALI